MRVSQHRARAAAPPGKGRRRSRRSRAGSSGPAEDLRVALVGTGGGESFPEGSLERRDRVLTAHREHDPLEAAFLGEVPTDLLDLDLGCLVEGKPATPVPNATIASDRQPSSSATLSVAAAAERMISAEVGPPRRMVAAWITQRHWRSPPLVATASPSPIGASSFDSSWIERPPARTIAPATPPTCARLVLAAFAIASTSSWVMSVSSASMVAITPPGSAVLGLQARRGRSARRARPFRPVPFALRIRCGGRSTQWGAARSSRRHVGLVLVDVEAGCTDAPSASARASAVESTSGPREVLTRTASGFIASSSAAPIRWWVSALAGACRLTTSERSSNSASSARMAPSARSASGLSERACRAARRRAA